jgi:hypothetical protein
MRWSVVCPTLKSGAAWPTCSMREL